MMMIMGIRRECKNGSRPRRMRRMGNDEKGEVCHELEGGVPVIRLYVCLSIRSKSRVML